MWEWRTIARSPVVSSCMADGDEVERLLERGVPEAEVGGRDRRCETVIEGLREAEALVDRVPAELDRDLVGTQPSGVEEAEHLDPVEVVLAEPPELLRPV